MIFTELFFTYENKWGTAIEGTISLPFEDEIFYKPIHINITGGLLDKEHLGNTGRGGQANRDKKNEIISGFTENLPTSQPQKIIKSYCFRKHTGLVAAMGVINGYNSNKEGKMMVRIFGEEYKAAKLFQNLKKLKTNPEFISMPFDKFEKENGKTLKKLIAHYNQSVKTVSTKDIKRR